MKQYPNCYLHELFINNIGKRVLFENEYVYPFDLIKIKNNDMIRLSFVDNPANVDQAATFTSDKQIETDEVKVKSIAFWYDGKGKYIDFKVKTKKGVLQIETGWKENGQMYFLRGNAALKKQKNEDGSVTYYCCYGFSNLKFNGLVFNVKFLNGKKVESLMDDPQ